LQKNNSNSDAVLQVMADRLPDKNSLKTGISPRLCSMDAGWSDCAEESGLTCEAALRLEEVRAVGA
jgi:hypothetical protein